MRNQKIFHVLTALAICIFFLANPSWAEDRIEDVSFDCETSEIQIDFWLSDCIERAPVFMQTDWDSGEILIQIFTNPLSESCGDESQYQMTVPYIEPVDQGTQVRVNVVLYQGSPCLDGEVELADSVLEISECVNEPDPTPEGIIVDGCETGVEDQLFQGKLISEWIEDCAENAKNHGRFVRCVAHTTNDMREAGVITPQEGGAIVSCAAQADIP